LVEIKTTGDQVQDAPLSQIGGEGLFTKEIQRALLSETIDVAVHSLKDLPTIPVDGLVLAAVPARGPVNDVFVSRGHPSLDRLPEGAVVATGSLRRRVQLLHRRRDLNVVAIRGNVETRLRKLDEEGIDGLVLAQAGLERLGLTSAIAEVLDSAWMLPAVGQGALALECRSNDRETRALLEQLNDPDTHRAVSAERALLRSLGCGCQVPVGALATVAGPVLSIRAAVFDRRGERRADGSVTGSADTAEELGVRLAHRLSAAGAQELLAEQGS
jgi:hydroxymethylbilane synthase